MNHTDYTFPNAADDTSRDKNVLRHGCGGSWVGTKENFSIDLSRLANLFIHYASYRRRVNACTRLGNDTRASENALAVGGREAVGAVGERACYISFRADP